MGNLLNHKAKLTPFIPAGEPPELLYVQPRRTRGEQAAAVQREMDADGCGAWEARHLGSYYRVHFDRDSAYIVVGSNV